MPDTRYTFLDTPIGALLLAGADECLRCIGFPTGKGAVTPRADWHQDDAAFAEARRQLSAYFEGRLTRFDLELDPRGTPFQRQVWTALMDIPPGETISYGELARRIGRPSASRAVGAANGANPLPIVVPCHRVIGAAGSLTGFAGGLDTKRWLLALERGATSRVSAQLSLL
ncbi:MULTISPECIES: methylated-DNA--[protein]-cysteine S-methyltransferase [unclassified Methylobacterium]|uniref:methylated-DNA--[protein]-cysteine S-methyltransferase n=1 Tax=unclassified Methylobacterium TaxID=2615210 RepID=UPI0006FBA781|nr:MULTISPECIES: methylated-DNA--[protein]-cysteine S-methyltransferase [unclassified Methylobacterium]KQO57033.1 cysteine methyltransferase [Methylobacterium sp. Leaf86]KQO93581.1 cysteine methyltransferase [Methylobacterium sp. Leaf91]